MSNSEDYIKAVNLVLTERRAGAAFLKQKLLLSDSKVARLLKEMQENGVVSKVLLGGARNVLLDPPPPPPPPEVDLDVAEQTPWRLEDVVQVDVDPDDE